MTTLVNRDKEIRGVTYTLREKVEGSQEYSLSYDSNGHNKSTDGLYSKKKNILKIDDNGPYLATYRDGGGSTHTGNRKIKLEWSSGKLLMSHFEFTSFHDGAYSEARCDNVIFNKQ